MKIGCLFFDNDPKTNLKGKIERALAYYQRKYQRTANLVFIHPTMNPDNITIEGVEIHTNRSVLPNHFWIGVKEERNVQAIRPDTQYD